MRAVIHDAPPAPPQPRPGLVVRVRKAEQPYVYHDNKLQPGTVGMLTEVKKAGWCTLQVPKLGARKLLHSSELEYVTLDEAAAVKEFIRSEPHLHLSLYKSSTTGSDPEVFAVDAQGQVIPAFAFLPPKDKPLAEDTGYCYAFWDGFQAEFTAAQSHCHAHFVDRIHWGLQMVQREARKIDPEARLTHRCVMDIPDEIMAISPPEGIALGCQPSLNVYGRTDHLQDLNPATLPLRFAGFHVHLGLDDNIPSDEQVIKGVRCIDRIAGVVSVVLLRGLEDARRRQFYGQAGEYRRTRYGIEYRSLSSACLIHPAVTHLMLDLTRQAFMMGVYGIGLTWSGKADEARRVIDTLDVEHAQAILQRNNKVLSHLLDEKYGVGGGSVAKRLIHEGAGNLLSHDMDANWKLTNDEWRTHSDGSNQRIGSLTL